MPRTATGDPPTPRHTAPTRRDALLDVARALVVERGATAVTMGSVAERAEVTRALVYKHFDNRDAVLGALYQREATALDRRLRRQVAAADDGFEPKFRSFVQAIGEAADANAFFALLRPFGHDPNQRRQQRSWDRRTLDYFTTLAADEFELDPAITRPAMSVLLSGIVSLLTQSRTDRSSRQRAWLEDVVTDLAVAGLRHLPSPSPG